MCSSDLQSILDAELLASLLANCDDPVQALQAYEAERLPRTRDIVLTNRSTPPDAIIERVDALTASGVPATFLNSSLSADESRARLRALHNGEFRLLYAAPERVTTPACGVRSPVTSRSRVVFPAPLAPTRATLAPSPTRKDTSSSSTRPSGNSKRTQIGRAHV